MSVILGYSLPEKNSGSPIGFIKEKKAVAINELITDNGEAHLLTIAPTGAGKGRSNIIPNCLTYKGSMILIDTKGEAASITAEVRKKYGQVVIIDPFKVVTKTPDKFNPLDIALDGFPVEQQGVMLTDAFMGTLDTISSDPYWDNKAFELIAGLMVHELTAEKNFQNVRNLLFCNEVDYNIAVLMDSKKITSPFAYDLIAAYLTIPSDKTRPCVLSTAQQYISILSDPVVMNSLAGPSTFDVKHLLSGEPITIYFVIPPNKLRTYSPLLRVWISSLLFLLMERTTRPAQPTLMILDEAANLGKIDLLVTAITLMRSYGLRIWTIFQDAGQLKRLYDKDWTTIINNCDVVQAYGMRNHLMAKEIAEIFGEVTAKELLQLPPEQALMCQAGKGISKIERLDYLKDKMFKKYEYGENKMYANTK